MRSGCTAIPLYSDGERIGTIVTGLSMASSTGTNKASPCSRTVAFTAVLLIIVGFAARWVLNVGLPARGQG